jgi:hypothetical protein
VTTQSYTAVNTYTTGSKLAQADWNNMASILNNGLSTFTTSGTYTSTGSNAVGPFFVCAGIVDETTNSNSEIIFAPFGGNFPNGVIMVLTTQTYQSSAGSGGDQRGHICHPDYANTNKSQIVLYCATQSGTALGSGISVRVNVLVIGY